MLQGDLRSNDFLQVCRYRAALHDKPADGRAFHFLQICRYALDNSGVSSSWLLAHPVRSKMSPSAATVLPSPPSTPSSTGKAPCGRHSRQASVLRDLQYSVVKERGRTSAWAALCFKSAYSKDQNNRQHRLGAVTVVLSSHLHDFRANIFRIARAWKDA